MPLATTIRSLYRGLGPGILLAAAAIGGSHLVSATRAGAEFGWQLAGLIILANVMRYPFFSVGPRFTIATGKSLQQGYLEQGKAYLIIFAVLNAGVSISTTAGVTMLTAAILTLFVPLSVSQLAALILFSGVLLLTLGHYRLLDKIAKWVMATLTVTTIAAALIASNNYSPPADNFIAPNPWQLVHLGFLVAMMGWMPAPIEVSVWNSLWLLEKQKQQPISKQQALFDFNVGYVTTTVLALVFMALGALVMFGSGMHFATSGTQFASQLVAMYTEVMGTQARWLIGSVVLLCIWGTTITVLDGYSRSLADALSLLKVSNCRFSGIQRQPLIMIIISVLALSLIIFFSGALLPLLELVMAISFITTLIFAWLNYRLMTLPSLPKTDRFGTKMTCLSWVGLFYLATFVGLFFYWYGWIK